MTAGQGWSYPPSPPRFAPLWILPGVVVGGVGTPTLSYLGIVLDPSLRSGWTFLWLLFAPLGPLLLGAIVAAVPGPPARRGFGLGLVLGWAPASVVAAGVCLFANTIVEQMQAAAAPVLL